MSESDWEQVAAATYGAYTEGLIGCVLLWSRLDSSDKNMWVRIAQATVAKAKEIEAAGE